MSASIIIIGGGVIGLSIGWHLTELGLQPLLLEKETVGCEASSAAAGMITPASEVRYGEETLLELFLESLGLYREFIQKIEAASGMSVDFNTTGSMMIAIDQDDEAELVRIYDYQKSLDLPVQLLTTSQVLEQEPNLSSHFSLGVQSTKECFLDNVLLVEALKQAYLKGGGILHEHCKVNHIEQKQGDLRVITEKETLEASQIVIASGIHALSGLPSEVKLPIRPVKGQALELQTRDTNPKPISRAIRTIHRYPVYLVPRQTGKIVIGATCEEMGLDQRVTAGGILDLLSGAWKILPGIDEMELLNTWVGFRPTSPDHSPILGPTTMPGVSVALGMYRHGILLTPVIGKLLSEWIAKEKPSRYLDTFSWKRFND